MDQVYQLLTGVKGQTAALGAAMFWAAATVLYGRIGRIVPPAEMNLLKNAMAIAMLVATLFPLGSLFAPVAPEALWLLLVSGAVGLGLGDTVYFESLKCMGARRVLLIMMLSPPLAGIGAHLAMGEMMTIAAWLGILVTVSGVAWVITERAAGSDNSDSQHARGIAFGLLAAAAQAAGAILSHAALVRTTVSPLHSGLLRLLGGAMVLVIWMVCRRRPLVGWHRQSTPVRLWGLLLLAVVLGTYLGIWLQQISLKYCAAGIAQTLFATSPLFVIPMAAATGERVSLRAVFGALVAMAGVYLLFAG